MAYQPRLRHSHNTLNGEKDWSQAVQRALLNCRILDGVIERVPDSIAQRYECSPIRVEGKSPALLCLHGFTGVPNEVRLACEVANELGLAARAPLLPGHGLSSLELARTSFSDWLAAARENFDEMRAQGPVILLGLSMGTLLATELALAAPADVAGLVLMSNAFWLRSPYPSLALACLDRLRIPNLNIRKNGADIGDEEARRSHVSSTAQPTFGAISVLRSGERLRERLAEIRSTTLILHGARDQVCPVDNAWRAAQRLSHCQSRVVLLPNSHHIITRDVDQLRVRQELLGFVREITATTVPAS